MVQKQILGLRKKKPRKKKNRYSGSMATEQFVETTEQQILKTYDLDLLMHGLIPSHKL